MELVRTALGQQQLSDANPERNVFESGSGKALEGGGGFGMVFENRYLLLIALLVLLLNVVNTSGEFLLSRLVVDEAERLGAASPELRRQFVGQFYAGFFAWVNVAGLAIQFFLVSRVFRHIGVAAALFVVPLIALGGYSLLALAPSLAAIRIVKIIENSGDYSLQNSARHALFLRTTREARYKAKAAIDTVFWRLGDLLQAGIVLVGSRMAFTTADFARQNLILTGLWLAVVGLLYREYAKAGPERPEPAPQRVYQPARVRPVTCIPVLAASRGECS